MDIKVQLSSGQLLDLEMQVNHLSEYVNRSIYYMGKLINESLEVGEDYDMMKKTIIISIVDGTLFPQYEKAFSTYYLKEDDTNHKLSEMTQIHFLELGKIDITTKLVKEMTPHERLGAYFKHASDDSLTDYVDQLLDYEREVLGLTKPILEEISAEKEMREIAIAHEMWLHDVATMKKRARKEGLAEGCVEGADKKVISMVCKKLIKGKSAEVIAEELEEEFERICLICEVAEKFAPGYDVGKIYEALKGK